MVAIIFIMDMLYKKKGKSNCSGFTKRTEWLRNRVKERKNEKGLQKDNIGKRHYNQ